MVQVERVDRFKRQIDFRVVPTEDRGSGKKPGKPFKGRRKRSSNADSGHKSSDKKGAPKQDNSRQGQGKTLTHRPQKRRRRSKPKQ